MAGFGHWPLGLLLPGVVLWLNASFQYAGFSLGALAGGFTVAHASPGVVGWVGGSFEVLALLLVFVIERRRQARGLVVAA